MDIRQLRYFVQIVEAGSLSRAAEILRIAQPSLSTHLRSLEEELGVKLLVRHPRGVTATEFGIIFCDHARKILREVELSRDIVHSHAISPVGRVSVGLPTSACRGLSLPLVQAMTKRYGGISIHITEAMTGNLDEWIQMGRLDVALLYDHRAFGHVAWTEMMGEDLMLLVPPTSSLARERAVPFAAIAKLPLVVPGRPNVLRTVIDQIAARLDLTLTTTDCDSLAAIRQFVRFGHATIMPHFAMAEEIERGEMVPVGIVEPTPSWRLSVVVSQRTLNLRASQMVAEVLADVIATLVESGGWKARLRTSERGGRPESRPSSTGTSGKARGTYSPR